MRDYDLPDLLPGENNWDWCRRAAASIPAESLMRQVVAHLMRPTRRRRSFDARHAHAWSRLGAVLGHGSGVSAAIVDRFRPREEGPDA